MPEFETLVQQLRQERRKREWSQRTLAQKADVSQSVIAKMERQGHTPNYKTVRKIWKALQKDKPEERIDISKLPNTIVSVDADDTVKKAGKLMEKNDFSQLPVKQDNQYIGLILDEHVIKSDGENKVSEVMKGITILSRDDPLNAVQTLVLKNHAVLLKGESEKMWIVTRHDLLFS